MEKKRLLKLKEVNLLAQNMTKKYLMISIVALLLVISSCIGIYAYLSDSETVNNTMVVGGVNIEVVEDFQPPEKLEPGVSFTKDVSIKNLGPSECYVRIKAVFTDSDMGDYCAVDWNTGDFVYNSEDGYYYYKKSLKVNEISESLFTKVTLSDEINANAIKDFDILVYAEAYQSEGFDDYIGAWEHYQRNKPSN